MKKKGKIIKLNKTDKCKTCKQSVETKKLRGLARAIKETKVDYPKLTFRLSVFGFVASIAFYFGVLRDLNNQKAKQVQTQITTPVMDTLSQITSDSIHIK